MRCRAWVAGSMEGPLDLEALRRWLDAAAEPHRFIPQTAEYDDEEFCRTCGLAEGRHR